MTTPIQTIQFLTSTWDATADDWGDRLGNVRLIEIAAEQARREIIAEARAAGETWEVIGDRLGVTRQAAQQRYGRA